MSAEAVIRALLVADAALTAVVPAARIYPSHVPVGAARPAIAFALVAGQRLPRINGQEATHMQRSRVSVEIEATDYVTLKSLRSKVIKACEFKAGTIAAVLVHVVQFAGEGGDDFDVAQEVYSEAVDFYVYFEAP